MAFYESLRAVVRPALRSGLRWTIEGEDHIPEEGAVILAANHISFLDALCVAYLADRRGRQPLFLAKAALFDIPLLGTILRALGDIPAGKSRRSKGSSLDVAADVLGDGGCLGIFPEGALSPDLEPLAGRTGVARLAQMTGAPVVPVGLWGTHRIWAKGRPPVPRLGVAEVVAVGAPIGVDAADDAREATDRIMAAICGQVSRARELYPHRAGEARPWWALEPDTARLQSCRNLTGEDELWAARRRIRDQG